MWNRPLIKEEAKKVFSFSSQNYWKMVLVALIIVVLSGGLGGSVSGVVSTVTGSFSSISNNKTKKPNKDYDYKREYTRDIDINGEEDVVKITDENGNVSKIHIHGDMDPREIAKQFQDNEAKQDIAQNQQQNQQQNAEQNSQQNAEQNKPEGYREDVGTWDEDRDYDVDIDDDIMTIMPYDDAKNSEAWGIAGAAIAVIVLIAIVIWLVGMTFALTVKAFLINPIILGCKAFFLRSYDRPCDLKLLGDGFRKQYIKNVGTMILRDIFTILWTLLFIVPGIIKAYEYRMIPYLIIENPNMSYKEAFAKSKEMMMGNKWEAFVFDLSFLGWFLLNMLTCGILGIFYVNPYYYAADANLFRAIKMGGSTGYVSEQYASVQTPTQNARPSQNAQPIQNEQPEAMTDSSAEPETKQTEEPAQEPVTDNTGVTADSSVQDSEENK